jgi:hypothetical protein
MRNYATGRSRRTCRRPSARDDEAVAFFLVHSGFESFGRATYRRNFGRSGFDPCAAVLFSQKRYEAVHYLASIDDEALHEGFEQPTDEVTVVGSEGRPER